MSENPLRNDLLAPAFEIAQLVAACPHSSICKSEFQKKYARSGSNHKVHFADVPSPDFIGSRYSGLVIIGGNPGLAHRGSHFENDLTMFELQREVAKGDRDAFEKLMSFLPFSMEHWPQVVDSDGRRRLKYDIEDVAYIDIVKCGTSPARGDTRALMAGTGVLGRCWETHTRKLLSVLAPTHILALWKPILGVLEGLGYSLKDKETGYYCGARHLTKETRYSTACGVVDSFYAR